MARKATKYYSKWRNAWVPFKTTPTTKELKLLKKYKYKTRR